MTSSLTSTSLFFRDGGSDKEYHASISPQGAGFIVTFAYGRRGSTLTTGTKTTHPVSLPEAEKIHAKLIKAKISKGYSESSTSQNPYVRTEHPTNAAEQTAIKCQLLNPADPSEIVEMLHNSQYCLQEKFDGCRLMILKKGSTITGINRRGLVVAIHASIAKAAQQIPHDALIDGEAVGETFHTFDILELDGKDLRTQPYLIRYSTLCRTIPAASKHIEVADNHVRRENKIAAFDQLRQQGREGAVFKHIRAPFSPGRPNSGGTQLKFKFVETASFIVTAHNQSRSVAIHLLDPKTKAKTPAGNVTIPPSPRIPPVGSIIEVRYLYAFRESGSIYQPVFLAERTDITPAECSTAQLKYKNEPAPSLAS